MATLLASVETLFWPADRVLCLAQMSGINCHGRMRPRHRYADIRGVDEVCSPISGETLGGQPLRLADPRGDFCLRPSSRINLWKWTHKSHGRVSSIAGSVHAFLERQPFAMNGPAWLVFVCCFAASARWRISIRCCQKPCRPTHHILSSSGHPDRRRDRVTPRPGKRGPCAHQPGQFRAAAVSAGGWLGKGIRLP